MPYAYKTKVPVEQTRGEVERVLAKYGANSFGYGWEGNRAVLMFTAKKRAIRMELTMPDRAKYGEDHVAQESRRLWRALLLIVKAKLEAVESGIATFENEFLPYTVLPTGETFGEWAAPQLDAAADSGQMPKLLTAGKPMEGGHQ